jgi:hypothetical protein
MASAYSTAATAGSGVAYDYTRQSVVQTAAIPNTITANYSPQGEYLQPNPIITGGTSGTLFYAAKTQTASDYAYHYLLAGDSPSLTAFSIYLPYDVTNPYFDDQISTNNSEFRIGFAAGIGLMSDLMAANMTVAQRKLTSQYLLIADNFCRYQATQSTGWFSPGNSNPGNSGNINSVSASACGMIMLSTLNVDPQASAGLARWDSNLNIYMAGAFYDDGIDPEGGQYEGFGLSTYLQYATIRSNVFGSDVPGLFSKPHISPVQAFYPYMIDGAGGWASAGVSGTCPDMTTFQWADTVPQHNPVDVLIELAPLATPNAQLVAEADCIVHIVASGASAYTGYMDQQTMGGSGFWPFYLRYTYGFSTTPTISGFPTYFNSGPSGSTVNSGCPTGCTTTTFSNFVVMRSDGSAVPPDGELLFHGKNIYNGIGHLAHQDEGSFTARFSGEEFLIDPGYNAGTDGAVNSYLSINNSLPAGVSGSAVLDTTNSSGTTSACARNSNYNNGGATAASTNYQSGCWITTKAFSTALPAVTLARRTGVLYSSQNGGTGAYHARALVILDDITSGTSYTVKNRYMSVKTGISSYCPSGCSTVNGSKYGYTLNGSNTNLNIEFHNLGGLTTFPQITKYYFCGADVTVSTNCQASNGVLGAGGSWVYNNLTGPYYGYYNALQSSWTSGTTNSDPLVTVIMPSAGGLSVPSYSNTGSVITITFSDASTIVFVSTAGGPWILQ